MVKWSQPLAGVEEFVGTGVRGSPTPLAPRDSYTRRLSVPVASVLITFLFFCTTVDSLVFSPDGKTIAFASGNTLILWDWNLDSLMVSACDWVRDYLKNSQEVEESDRHLCNGIASNYYVKIR